MGLKHSPRRSLAFSADSVVCSVTEWVAFSTFLMKVNTNGPSLTSETDLFLHPPSLRYLP